MTEIKPCPFCGSSKVFLSIEPATKQPMIHCHRCGVGIICAWFATTEESLIENYNRREHSEETHKTTDTVTRPAGEPRRIRGVFIDTYGSRKAHVREVLDTLPAWYTLLDCEVVDNPRLEISGTVYDVIADGEGLEAHGGRPLPSVIGRSGDPLILGPCFICRGVPSGEWVSLSEGEINDIFAHIKHKRVISPEDTDIDLLFME